MPRIRTIKPEFFTSPSTAKLSPDARILFIAMWCWADDYGKGETNLNGLLGLAFPESDEKDRKELHSLCKEVQSACNVEYYVVEERAYYAIPSWDKHQKTQRQAQSKIPDPDDARATPDPRFHAEVEGVTEMRGSSEHPQGSSVPGKGKGTGNREQLKPPAADADGQSEPPDDAALIPPEPPAPTVTELFTEFWDAYPRKDDKGKALEKFKAALNRAPAERIITGATRYRDDPNREAAYTKLPTTWLNADAWDNGPLPPRQGARQSSADARLERAHDIISRRMPGQRPPIQGEITQ